ncbi:MAG: RsmD family RNA methyltransferase, partial [Oscillospiraceae bacterium]|nr:RsmD family RNA methyltransferase [Oscillospiraceae bacterium]
MKVTSGSAGGIHIDYPSSSRPTTDKVRQAIFSALGSRIDFEGKSALDMFAGSGAMGIEALSRGAKTAVFIDTNKDACKIIQKNLEKAKLDTYGIILNIDFQKF